MNEWGVYEVSAKDKMHKGTFYMAKLTKVRGDGKYEATVQMPDRVTGEDFQEIHIPFVAIENIRMISGERAQPEEMDIQLLVKKDDPFNPGLTFNGHSFEDYFVAQSPPQGAPKAMVELNVNQAHTQLSGNVGHAQLAEFLKTGDDAVKVEGVSISKQKAEWSFELGPMVHHKVVLEAEKASGSFSTGKDTLKEITLRVDGKVVATCSGADGPKRDLRKDEWLLAVDLQGHKVLKYNLFQHKNGKPIDSQESIKKHIPYTYTIDVTCPTDHIDMTKAMLRINNKEFSEYREKPKQAIREENITDMPIDGFEHTFGLIVPYSVVRGESMGFADELNDAVKEVFSDVNAGCCLSWFSGLFDVCKSAPPASAEPESKH
jgi:flagellar hook-basal body complex protein FliE